MRYLTALYSLAFFSILVFTSSVWPLSFQDKDLYKLLKTKRCDECSLEGIDIVNTDLSGASLVNTLLKNSNLSGSNLDGVDLRGANLTHANLSATTLREADLTGAILQGTNFIESDLTDAVLDFGSLSTSNWQFAIGINPKYLTFIDVYNAGVSEYKGNRFRNAEKFFLEAIKKEPGNIKPLLACSSTRLKQGKTQLAVEDL